jgi:hypothetical protein
MRFIEMGTDLLLMPASDISLPFQGRQGRFEALPPQFILLRIGVEESKGP